MDLKNINLDLKNIDLQTIKSKIQSIDKKTLIKFGIWIWFSRFIFNYLLCNFKSNS